MYQISIHVNAIPGHRPVFMRSDQAWIYVLITEQSLTEFDQIHGTTFESMYDASGDGMTNLFNNYLSRY